MHELKKLVDEQKYLIELGVDYQRVGGMQNEQE